MSHLSGGDSKFTDVVTLVTSVFGSCRAKASVVSMLEWVGLTPSSWDGRCLHAFKATSSALA